MALSSGVKQQKDPGDGSASQSRKPPYEEGPEEPDAATAAHPGSFGAVAGDLSRSGGRSGSATRAPDGALWASAEKDRGNVYDEYEIGETLGRGSFAVVKEAWKKSDGQKFAIKMIEKNNPGVSVCMLNVCVCLCSILCSRLQISFEGPSGRG